MTMQIPQRKSQTRYAVLRRPPVSPSAKPCARSIRSSCPFNFKLRPDQVRKEVERFRGSVEKSREQLKRMQNELKKKSGPESSFLIDAHLLVLQDRLFVDRIIEKIETDYINSEWAIQQVSDDLFQAYDRLNDDYLRERRGDLEDIVRRLLHNLQMKPLPSFKKLPYDAILVGKACAAFDLI